MNAEDEAARAARFAEFNALDPLEQYRPRPLEELELGLRPSVRRCRVLEVSTPDDPSSRLRDVVREYLERVASPDPQAVRLAPAEGLLEHGPGHRAGHEITFTITNEVTERYRPDLVDRLNNEAGDAARAASSPYCAACRKPIHADPASPTGYVHAGTLRVACSTGGGQAHPAT